MLCYLPGTNELNRGNVGENVLHTKDSIRPSYITAKAQKQIYTSEVCQISFELYIILLETYVSIIFNDILKTLKKKKQINCGC